MEDIEALRAEIDRLDRALVPLLCARMEVTNRVGAYKKPRKLPVLAPEREQSLLTKIAGLAGEEQRESLLHIYRAILSASRAGQKAMGCGRYGLLGEKLGHSYSPEIHGLLGGYPYDLIELAPDELGDFLRAGNFDGLNVTMPYKKAVIPYCKRLTPRAEKLGSVNTIVRQPDGSLLGHNTDYDGFRYLLQSADARISGKKALVLGSGGASLTVQAVLKELGASEVVVISRSGPNHYGNLRKHADAAFLINATPVGMYPNNGACLVNLEDFPRLEGVFDLVYNPLKTKLLLEAERLHINGQGGLGMLVAQARAAAELFLERKIPDCVVGDITEQLTRSVRNVLLIGMPGCGKSTIGKALAEQLHRPLSDLDALIEQKAGRPIPEIFREEGEEVFRRLEHEVLCIESKKSGIVISCGGGIVTRPENLGLLRQNSMVIFLRRPLKELSTEGRPLSQRGNVEELYRVRLPLYEQAADLTVDNTTVEDTVSEIIRRVFVP